MIDRVEEGCQAISCSVCQPLHRYVKKPWHSGPRRLHRADVPAARCRNLRAELSYLRAWAAAAALSCSGLTLAPSVESSCSARASPPNDSSCSLALVSPVPRKQAMRLQAVRKTRAVDQGSLVKAVMDACISEMLRLLLSGLVKSSNSPCQHEYRCKLLAYMALDAAVQ
jgi:hypothetical protein